MFISLRIASQRLLTGLLATGSLLAATNPAVAQWTSQNSALPAISAISNFSIVDANTVWATGFDVTATTFAPYNSYTRTVNGGTTWVRGTIAAAAASQQTVCVSAVSSTNAWIGCNSTSAGYLYHTTDGSTWTSQLSSGFTSAQSGYINGVLAFNATTLVAVGDPVSATGPYEIYTSSDAGVTWTAAVTPPNATSAADYGFTTVVTVPGSSATTRSCWMGTSTGRVLRSIDSGKNWTAVATGLAQVNSVAFCSETNGIAVNSNDLTTIAYTLDGGLNWRTRTPTGAFYGLSVAGVPGQRNTFVGVDASSTPGSSYSVDGGTTWVAIDTGVPRFNVAFLNGTTGWSGGFSMSTSSGGVYKGTLPAAALATTPALAAADVTIYPNPATSIFAVRVPAVAGVAQVEARLYNTLGQETARQTVALPAAGAQLDFNTTTLAPGIYTLRVLAGAASTTRQVSIQ